jgi:hypothetical protein
VQLRTCKDDSCARTDALKLSSSEVCVRCAAQVVNFSEEIRSQLYKIASISLCSNLGGQIIMSLVMSPPKVRSLYVWKVCKQDHELCCRQSLGSC